LCNGSSVIKERTGKSFPQDPQAQLWGAIGAVFGSWMNDRAMVYRRKYGIPHDWGTAVNVQTMVFGNMGETSATGSHLRAIRRPVKKFFMASI
jgi:pyruvate,orthophosphate dikinase